MTCPGLHVSELRSELAIDCDHGAQFLMALAGTFRSAGDDARFECPAGSLLYRPAALPHRIELDDRARVLWLDIPVERFHAINAALLGVFAAPAFFPRRDVAAHGKWMQHEWHRQAVSPLSFEASALAMIERTAEVLRTRAACRPSWLDAAIVMLRAAPARRFTAEDLASAVGVRRGDLLHAVAVFERRPLRQIALEARLQAAREALLGTNSGIAEIAAETGFTDHAHLTRSFRKVFGTTPRDYRAIYRSTGL